MKFRCIIEGNLYIKLSIIGVLLLMDSIFSGYLGDRGDEQRKEYRPNTQSGIKIMSWCVSYIISMSKPLC